MSHAVAAEVRSDRGREGLLVCHMRACINATNARQQLEHGITRVVEGSRSKRAHHWTARADCWACVPGLHLALAVKGLGTSTCSSPENEEFPYFDIHPAPAYPLKGATRLQAQRAMLEASSERTSDCAFLYSVASKRLASTCIFVSCSDAVAGDVKVVYLHSTGEFEGKPASSAQAAPRKWSKAHMSDNTLLRITASESECHVRLKSDPVRAVIGPLLGYTLTCIASVRSY